MDKTKEQNLQLAIQMERRWQGIFSQGGIRRGQSACETNFRGISSGRKIFILRRIL